MQEELERAHKLIPEIYDAAVNPGSIPEILQKVADFIGAFGAIITEVSDAYTLTDYRIPHYSSGYDAALVEHYLDKYSSFELKDQSVFQHFSLQTDDIELISDEQLTTSRARLEKQPNVQFLKSIGIDYRAAALLNKDFINIDRFALQFTGQQGPLNQEHLRRCSLVLPHLSKALIVARPTAQLIEDNSAVLECLNLLKSAVCIIDAERRIILKNTEFDRQVESYDVFSVGADGRLAFTHEKSMKPAEQMFSNIGFHGRFGARPRKEAIELPTAKSPHELCLEIIPLGKTKQLDKGFHQGSIIFCLDTSLHSDIDVSGMSKAYGLTHSEKSVLHLIADGLSNRQIAETAGKSVETVNSQVKSILSKSMTSNRTQLIRLASQINSHLVG
ncbi:MAG: helix-turn-helix transcriptional regulator [Pseudomonadota bacterium]